MILNAWMLGNFFHAGLKAAAAGMPPAAFGLFSRGLLAALNVEAMGERLITTGIVALAGTIIGAWIGGKLTQKDVASLTERVGKIEEDHLERMRRIESIADRRDVEIAGLRQEQMNCELRAAQTFVTKGEIVSTAVQIGQLRHDLMGRMDDVHTRVNEVHDRVSELSNEFNHFKGEMEGAQT